MAFSRFQGQIEESDKEQQDKARQLTSFGRPAMKKNRKTTGTKM